MHQITIHHLTTASIIVVQVCRHGLVGLTIVVFLLMVKLWGPAWGTQISAHYHNQHFLDSMGQKQTLKLTTYNQLLSNLLPNLHLSSSTYTMKLATRMFFNHYSFTSMHLASILSMAKTTTLSCIQFIICQIQIQLISLQQQYFLMQQQGETKRIGSLIRYLTISTTTQQINRIGFLRKFRSQDF